MYRIKILETTSDMVRFLNEKKIQPNNIIDVHHCGDYLTLVYFEEV